MSGSLRFEWNNAGIQALLYEAGQSLCASEAARVASAAGVEYDVKKMETRTIASVYTTDPEKADAILRNLK